MPLVDFLTQLHTSTKRDYLERVCKHDKAACAEKAALFGKDYWDGDRSTGYGGYHYDGRWRAVAEKIVEHYKLPSDATILDIGCGKGFLLYEFTQILPGARVAGIDISQYAIDNSKEEIRDFLKSANASALPFDDASFDFVYSINTLHNLYIDGIFEALREMERVRRGPACLTVEGYRSEREKVNLMYWQLTCRAFHTPDEWEWIFEKAGYTGDYSFIYFE